MPSDLRTRKRLATRQSISTAATRLFLERGFDNVTVDEIATAADVGRMTVFNHFPRKEDMFFDREEEGREILRHALRQRPTDMTPIEALRRLAHQLIDEQSPLLEFSAASQQFIATIGNSENLKSRVRAIRGELTQLVTAELAQCLGKESDDPDAYLAANLLLATWSAALIQAHRHYQRNQNSDAAQALFLSIVEKGTQGLQAALTGTEYV